MKVGDFVRSMTRLDQIKVRLGDERILQTSTDYLAVCQIERDRALEDAREKHSELLRLANEAVAF